MKLKVFVGASENKRQFVFKPTDYGFTDEQFELLTDGERENLIQEWIDSEPDQPCWVFESFSRQH